MSSCGVNGSGTAAVTDVGCGEVVTAPRNLRCTATVTGYVPPSSIGPTTTLSVIKTIGGVNSIFGGAGGPNGFTFWHAAPSGATTTSNSFSMEAAVASGTSLNFGCRVANMTAATQVACNVSWICF